MHAERDERKDVQRLLHIVGLRESENHDAVHGRGSDAFYPFPAVCEDKSTQRNDEWFETASWHIFHPPCFPRYPLVEALPSRLPSIHASLSADEMLLQSPCSIVCPYTKEEDQMQGYLACDVRRRRDVFFVKEKKDLASHPLSVDSPIQRVCVPPKYLFDGIQQGPHRKT